MTELNELQLANREKQIKKIEAVVSLKYKAQWFRNVMIGIFVLGIVITLIGGVITWVSTGAGIGIVALALYSLKTEADYLDKLSKEYGV